MISAVDSCVLLDVFANDPVHKSSSTALLTQANRNGRLVICAVAYAEMACQFDDKSALDNALTKINVRLRLGHEQASFLAGQRWMQYRQAGGPRTRILPDFLIGAHALTHADRLLTRDRGFYKTYFPELTLLG